MHELRSGFTERLYHQERSKSSYLLNIIRRAFSWSFGHAHTKSLHQRVLQLSDDAPLRQRHRLPEKETRSCDWVSLLARCKKSKRVSAHAIGEPRWFTECSKDVTSERSHFDIKRSTATMHDKIVQFRQVVAVHKDITTIKDATEPRPRLTPRDSARLCSTQLDLPRLPGIAKQPRAKTHFTLSYDPSRLPPRHITDCLLS